MRPLALFVALASAAPASAAGSVKIKDALAQAGIQAPSGALKGAPPALPPAARPVLPAPDVVDDPRAADEVLTHLPARLELREEAVKAGIVKGALILNRAEAKAEAEVKRIFARVSSALMDSTVTWPQPGYDFKGCDAGTLAFVYRGGRKIYLCSAAFALAEKGMGQVFIHEGAHVAGYYDECDASLIEVAAMKISGEGLAFKNGYLQRCGIEAAAVGPSLR